jgi:hypothetical protein
MYVTADQLTAHRIDRKRAGERVGLDAKELEL